MRIGIPKEIALGENRVAIVPSLLNDLKKLNCELFIEKDAGKAAQYLDESYQGFTVCDDKKALYQSAEIILTVSGPSDDEIKLLNKNSVLIGLLNPYSQFNRIKALQEQQITSFALELLPRISRAQAMDALSSQATIAGYKAALLAANLSQRFFPMLTTAIGTIKPSSVLIIGAGVAGLQAIATARRLGAVVQAYDIRSSAREQIESLGARMINIDITADAQGGYGRELTTEEQQRQKEALLQTFSKSEIVISTALIPGKPAPKIITQDMVEAMPAGAIIVDIAAQMGGNCVLTKPDATIEHHNVTIYGPINLPSMMARDASNMYAKNIYNFLKLIINNGELNFNWQDEIIAGSALTHEGEIRNPAIMELMKGNTL